MASKRELSEIDSSKIRLIVSDVDGTLLNPSSTLSPKTASTIRRVLTSNPTIKFLFATGKYRSAIESIAPSLTPPHQQSNLPPSGVYLNGGVAYNSEKLIYSVKLSNELSLKHFDFAERFGLVVCVYSTNRIFATRHTDFTEFELHDKLREPKAEIIDAAVLRGWIRDCEIDVYKLLFCGNEKFVRAELGGDVKLEDLEDGVIGKWCDLDVWFLDRVLKHFVPVGEGDLGYQTTRALAFALEVLPSASGKKAALEKLVESLGCEMKDVLAFGDGDNDTEMLKSVGYGIAMANAHENTMNAVKYVTKSNKEDGLAHALDIIFPESN